MNKAASELGKLAAGVPKKYSPAEIAKRTARLRKAQKNRAKTQRALRRLTKEKMTANQFNKRLAALNERVRKATVKLMEQAREQNADGMGGGDPVDFADNPQTERLCDSLCEMGAWMHDRLNGRSAGDPRTVGYKVRKALGYTYP